VRKPQSRLDDLTGLRNPRALREELEERQRSGSAVGPLTVVMVDFDRLGEVNHRYDRAVGDAVVCAGAAVARDEAPSSRLVFRYGDDDLVLLVPGDEEDGREVAERVRERIAAQNNDVPAVTVSCGVAALDSPREAWIALDQAGDALRAAKRGGGNRVALVTELEENGNGGVEDEGSARRAALRVAVAALEVRNRETADHSDDVVTLCESIGRRLGFTNGALDRLEAGAQLHDIGKVGVPTEILNKPGPLSDSEWAVIREHTVIGERILRSVPEMAEVATMVRHSHERWDGTGYPDGLAGEEIPLASRIILCADAFHAIRSDRAYRPGRSADKAFAELRACAGSQFDPRIVDELVAVAHEVRAIPRAGSRVALRRSRRLAVLLAALAVGGGSAYAASENVRHAVKGVVDVLVPGAIVEPADAAAGDFPLRPLDQVSSIVPTTARSGGDSWLLASKGAPVPDDKADRTQGDAGLSGSGPPASHDVGAVGDTPDLVKQDGDAAPPAGSTLAEYKHEAGLDESPAVADAELGPIAQAAPTLPPAATPTHGSTAQVALTPLPVLAPEATAEPPAGAPLLEVPALVGGPADELIELPARGKPDRPARGNPNGEPPARSKPLDELLELPELDIPDDELVEPPASGNPHGEPPGLAKRVDELLELPELESALVELPALGDPNPDPPALGNPHGEPPGLAKRDEELVELPELENALVELPALDDPDPDPPALGNPHGEPPGLAKADEELVELPELDTPDDELVEPPAHGNPHGEPPGLAKADEVLDPPALGNPHGGPPAVGNPHGAPPPRAQGNPPARGDAESAPEISEPAVEIPEPAAEFAEPTADVVPEPATELAEPAEEISELAEDIASIFTPGASIFTPGASVFSPVASIFTPAARPPGHVPAPARPGTLPTA
jgi:diguanylate cyclase (GGDEF)-like protein